MSPLLQAGFIKARRVLSFQEKGQGDAIWWENGKIREIGPARALASRVPRDIPQFEFPDGLVTPGFTDSHTHFAMWARGRTQVQLGGTRSSKEAAARVAAAQPVNGWVLGQGWDANAWPTPPERWTLDPVQSGPVFLDSVDVHAAWVNSAALALAGINRETADPSGGRIVRDESGIPTGLLLERAVDLVRSVIPEPGPDLLTEALLSAQREAHRLGITGIHNVEHQGVFLAMARMAGADTLRLRVLFHHPVADLDRLVQAGIQSGAGGPWLVHGGVKMFLDGSLGSRTAWMLEPYEGTRDRGMPVSDKALARAAMTLAADHGIASVVHAIGDAAVRRALELMEPLAPVGICHRIEHFQCVHPADTARAARSGISLSMQPAHILSDIPLADRHWGKRAAGAYAFRTLANQGSLLTFGSDTPVASIDPREGVYAALDRRLDDGSPAWFPAERLDFESVIRAYTVAPALTAGIIHQRGTLAPGMDADLVVWDVDPAAEQGSGAAFRKGNAVLTVVAGEAVYYSPSAT
jgi:predicted amidohydrolase YtcJ